MALVDLGDGRLWNTTSEQDRADRYRRQAAQFEAMVEALESGKLQRVEWLPKYVPRGTSLDWYRQKAQRLREQEALAQELADVWEHEKHCQWQARMSPRLRAEYEEVHCGMILKQLEILLRTLPLAARKAILRSLQDTILESDSGL